MINKLFKMLQNLFNKDSERFLNYMSVLLIFPLIFIYLYGLFLGITIIFNFFIILYILPMIFLNIWNYFFNKVGFTKQIYFFIILSILWIIYSAITNIKFIFFIFISIVMAILFKMVNNR